MDTVAKLLEDKEQLAKTIYDLLDNFTKVYGVVPTVIVETYSQPDTFKDVKHLLDVRIEVTL